MQPVDVATNLLEAFNTGDLDGMREFVASDMIASARHTHQTACDVMHG